MRMAPHLLKPTSTRKLFSFCLCVSLSSRCRSFKFGNCDALYLWVVIFVVKTVALKGERLHLVVVEGADGVNVGAGSELL